MDTLWQDVRYGWRQLARSPGFTAVAVVTLALGIGANTAIFSVVHAVLMEPLPYRDPERLVLVWNRMETTHFPKAPVSAPDLVDYRRQAKLFAGFAATNNVPDGALTGDGEPLQVKVGAVTANFFSLLGVRPFLGRDFTAADEVPIPQQVFQDPNATIPTSALVLSHGFWLRRFGGDPKVLGKVVRINGQPLEVVGVMPEGFSLLMPPDAGMPTDIDAWTPLRFDLATGARDQQFLRVVARLKPGTTLEQARGEMESIAAHQREQFQFHKNMQVHVDVAPMRGDVVGRVRPILLALLGAVLFVLLIACANVANLLLARATARGREMAVRAALGAERWRIARQTLTEGALLALLGGALGLLLAHWGVRTLVALKPASLPRLDTIGIDGAVLAFTLAAAAVSALVFGLAPALACAASGSAALRERSGGAGRSAPRSALVVAEVALSLVLLAGAGLMLRSFLRLSEVRPGFDPRGVLTYGLQLPFTTYRDPADRSRFFHRMEERIAALPGVEAVGSVFPVPLGGRFWTGPYGRKQDPVESWTKNEASFRVITPGYFAAMGTRVLAGRGFTPADDEDGARPVAVVDKTLAAKLWPGRSPLGEPLGIDLFGQQQFLEVVGVVEPVRHDDLTRDGRETLYFPHHLFPFTQMTVAVRSAAAPAALVAPVRREVRAMDRELPVYDVGTLEEAFARAMAPTRFTLVLIGIFAGVALLLASVGLYGVLAYAVRQRTREIGVRLALGAQRGGILRLVVGRGLKLVLAGVALGLVAALALTRSIEGLLFGVTPTDPTTFAGVAALLTAVALWACYLPAQRATRVDPMESLRGE